MEVSFYNFWEHNSEIYEIQKFPQEIVLTSKPFGYSKNRYAFEINANQEQYKITAGYFIGVDWLAEGHSAIIVAPKLNTRPDAIFKLAETDQDIELDEAATSNNQNGETLDIDYFNLLRDCIHNEYLQDHLDDLVHIEWRSLEIPISIENDWLTPLLIVKYLNLLKRIVRKGLKKSYNQVVKNLNSKIKGKILIGQNIKQNTAKNRITNTVCQFDEFGVDNIENRILKKAMLFSQAYLNNYGSVFNTNLNYLQEIINYSRLPFEMISDNVDFTKAKNLKPNPFFKEYNKAVELARLVLKRFSYTLSNTSSVTMTTPPYWIDMPRLFEMYVYNLLQIRFPNQVNDVKYHFATYGNELDFLIKSGEIKMVVDAKYKPLYIYGVNHSDVRQVSGYSRLSKVFSELEISDDHLIDCLIIYPDIRNGLTPAEFSELDFKALPKIKAYKNVYKIGIKLPLRSSVSS